MCLNSRNLWWHYLFYGILTLEKFSRIVVGCWRLLDWQKSTEELQRYISDAVDLGLTSFDHADIYGDYQCEAAFGQALTPVLREKVQLITKCGIGLVSSARPAHRIKHYNLSKSHIVSSVEQSLTNLRTDRIDLLMLHRPDPLMDADEVADAFESLRKSGKVLEFGVSNFSSREFELLNDRFPLSTNQLEISVVQPDALFSGIMELMQQLRVAPMAWSPLAGGRLFANDNERLQSVHDTLTSLSATYSATVSSIALAWLIKHPARIYPVVGSGKTDRLREYVRAMDIQLSRQDWFAILRASRGVDVA
ncbi:MAG: aldo/keto reductase [Rhodothermales bacterium]|nr:aldo/keto reductase [Rhodothermales bacterium]